MEDTSEQTSKSRNRSAQKLGIKRNQNLKTHPMNRDLFGSPRDTAQFKALTLGKQAGLEQTENRQGENAVFDVDAVFKSMKNNL